MAATNHLVIVRLGCTLLVSWDASAVSQGLVGIVARVTVIETVGLGCNRSIPDFPLERPRGRFFPIE